MTWKNSTWLLQWGPAGGTLSQVVKPTSSVSIFSFHYPGGTPLWVVVKGDIYLRQWSTGKVTGGLRPGRWITRWVQNCSTRWADRGEAHPGGINWAVRGVSGVFRPMGFDFSRWKFCLRGTDPVGWSRLPDPELYLLRPRYV